MKKPVYKSLSCAKRLLNKVNYKCFVDWFFDRRKTAIVFYGKGCNGKTFLSELVRQDLGQLIDYSIIETNSPPDFRVVGNLIHVIYFKKQLRPKCYGRTTNRTTDQR